MGSVCLTLHCLSWQKLQLALAPVSSLFPLSLDEGVAERTTFLTHSIQQLDRIDSLSEQIGFLEERLGTCECLSVRFIFPSGNIYRPIVCIHV